MLKSIEIEENESEKGSINLEKVITGICSYIIINLLFVSFLPKIVEATRIFKELFDIPKLNSNNLLKVLFLSGIEFIIPIVFLVVVYVFGTKYLYKILYTCFLILKK